MNSVNDKYLSILRKSLTGCLDTKQPENWQFRIDSTRAFKAFMSNGHIRTLVGQARLSNIEACVKHITSNQVKGDVVEAGCWRGGALLYLKACLDLYENECTVSRKIWGADLFPESSQIVTSHLKLILLKGLIKIRKILPLSYQQRLANYIMEAFPQEIYDKSTLQKIFTLGKSLTYISKENLISTSHEDLLEAFKRYDLYDDKIKLVPGWFNDTLPIIKDKINNIAILRVDADFYQSTLEVLQNLYPKLSKNGICIIDDYGGFIECRKAVDEYRQQHGITDPLISVDGICYYWISNTSIQ